MKLLLTGSAGYSGTGIAQALAAHHDIRGFDIKDSVDLKDYITGDITDLDTCRRAVEGVDAVVFCHMAPNPHGYETPVMGIDINVKGTANVYHAMVEQKLTRAVLISSTGTLAGDRLDNVPIGDGPYGFDKGMYAISKVLQENVARYYHDAHQIITTALRPGWIVYDGTLTTKYGQKLESYNASLIDPRDIGDAVHLSLQLTDPKLEPFIIAQDDSEQDQSATHDRLKWHPQHTFDALRTNA